MQHGNRQVVSGQAGRDGVAEPAFTGPTLTTAVLGALAEHTRGHPDRPALIDAADGRTLTYAELASVVPAAGAGLARRGVQTGDVAAIYVRGARELALAVHAVTAAGAVPAPIPPTSPGQPGVDELAARLTGCGARLLMTASPLGEDALAAADRSYVRQVFTFDDVPGATPFGELLVGGGPRPHIDPLHDYALLVDDPPERLTHADRLADLYRLAAAVALDPGEVLVAASVACPVPTWVGLIDVALLRGAVFAAVTRAGSAPLLRAIETYGPAVAVVSPELLKTLAYSDSAIPGPGLPLRVLVTGPAPIEVVRACRRRYDWSVESLN